MSKAKSITKEQTEEILKLMNFYKCKDVAIKVGVTINQVYDVRRRYKIGNKTNQELSLNSLQEQIFLGGKLGDGNFKSNGLYNYYYRENHAEDEFEYLEWKMKTLGENIINNGEIYKIKKSGYGVQQPYGFSTKTSPTLIKYAEMSLNEAILNLDYRGLIIYLLDDGWFSKHSKVGNFCLSGGVLSDEQLELVCKQFEKYNIKNSHIVGIKRRDISIPNENNKILYELATSFIPKETDVIRKKFSHIESYLNLN